MSVLETGYFSSPIGTIRLTGNRDALTSLYFVDEPCPNESQPESLLPYLEQLQEYFVGTLQEFNIPIELEGTEFQRKVWRSLTEIPYGTTISYGTLAERIGQSIAASRAVGSANGSNPISIIVPCHRVIGSNGKLVGYGGGLWRKRWLLAFERDHCNPSLFVQ